jgi:hypothetical protein
MEPPLRGLPVTEARRSMQFKNPSLLALLAVVVTLTAGCPDEEAPADDTGIADAAGDADVRTDLPRDGGGDLGDTQTDPDARRDADAPTDLAQDPSEDGGADLGDTGEDVAEDTTTTPDADATVDAETDADATTTPDADGGYDAEDADVTALPDADAGYDAADLPPGVDAADAADAPPEYVDWCRLQHPSSIEGAPGATETIYARVYHAGITDLSGGTDASGRLVLEAGHGPNDSDPDDSWTWVDGEPNLGWSDGPEPGNDEYQADLTLPLAEGNYDYAWRVSVDGGPWTYCDRRISESSDGSADGYSPANAGALTVEDVCAPNPCTAAPAFCEDGETLSSPTLPGACTRTEEGPQCDYTYAPVDCTDSGRICEEGACVLPPGPCNPNPCTEVPAASCVDETTIRVYEGVCTEAGFDSTCDYPDEVRSCVTDTTDLCLEDACVALPRYPSVGEVIITEVMVASQGGAGDQGEWVELYNTTAAALRLHDCAIGLFGDEYTFRGGLVIGAGERLIVGASARVEDNHGAPVAVTWGPITLSNSGETFELRCAGAVVDGVRWFSSQVEPGASIQLSAAFTDATSNDSQTHWCLSETTFGVAEKLGTPGAINHGCDTDPLPTPWCRLQAPPTMSLQENTTGTVYGRVYVEGVTPTTDGVDADPRLRLQAGVGPDGALPELAPGLWTWSDAEPNEDYGTGSPSHEPSNDEYVATITAPALGGSPSGVRDYAFRASGDGGTTWVYCDGDAGDGQDGSEDGYQPENAGALTITPEPDLCDPNPCTNPGPDVCLDDTRLGRAPTVGDCDTVAGEPVCTYPPSVIHCTVFDGICLDAECVSLPGFPGGGDVVITELMVAAAGGASDPGEWIELYNTNEIPYRLHGCTLGTDEAPAQFRFGEGLTIAADSRVVVAASDGPDTAGVPVAQVWSGFSLNDAGQSLRLTCNGNLVDRMTYIGADIEAGRSWQLTTEATSASGNDSAANWCGAFSEFGDAERLGTPGATNPPCSLAEPWCRYQGPWPLNVVENASEVAYGRVYIEGLTDQTGGGDPDDRLIAAAGYGNVDTDPANDASWVWFDAALNDAYGLTSPNYEENNDEYQATIVAPDVPGVPRNFDVAFRFSSDGGENWTYCDGFGGPGQDGSQDGYTYANAPTMTVGVAEDACNPNPCLADGDYCLDSSTLRDYETVADCVDVDGEAECSTSFEDVDCGEGFICDGGACGWTGAVYPVGWCRLQFPEAVTLSASESATFYGRVYIDEVTDRTSGTDVDVSVRAQWGYGNTANLLDWTWINAVANPGWVDTEEPGNDEYQVTFEAPTVVVPGAYLHFFRFSGDGGQSWTYCDIDAGPGSDGSEDNITFETAGDLTFE